LLFIPHTAAFIPVLHRRGFGGHAIFFISPAAKVYQLAAFGTERAVRIVLPLGGFTTVRTSHNEKLKIKNAKWKTKSELFIFHFAFLILHFEFFRLLPAILDA
jgi:hypothetical protein